MHAAETLRKALGTFYPELAKKPFVGTRMCWYLDTPDSDWILDFHPQNPNLFIATGGSGHAYKVNKTVFNHMLRIDPTS